MKKGKVRNPWIVLLLTFVTFGLYLIYWLVITLIELKNAVKYEKGEKQIKLTFMFFIIGALLTAAFIIYAIIASYLMEYQSLFFYSAIYTFIMVIISGFFFYFLCSATVLAQKKTKVEPFELITVFGIYLLNILIEGGSDILVLSSKFFKNIPSNIDKSNSIDINSLQDLLPILNMAGIINLISTVLFFLFLFLLQKQFNRLWEEGIFTED